MNKVAVANFEGLSHGGKRADIAKNLLASLFNDNLSNDTTFYQIHLDGQYPQEQHFSTTFTLVHRVPVSVSSKYIYHENHIKNNKLVIQVYRKVMFFKSFQISMFQLCLQHSGKGIFCIHPVLYKLLI